MGEIHHASSSFGDQNRGVQLGQISGTVNINYSQLSQEQHVRIRHECHQLLRVTSGSGEGYEWYKDRIEERVEGTCEWFLNNENYKTWCSRTSGPLLVSADPGCGKSVLAKYLVDEKLTGVVCYFFFKDQDQCSEKQLLCALLHQLFSQVPELIEHAVPVHHRNGEKFRDVTRLLWEIFVEATKDPNAGTVTMVLDALDECNPTDLRDLLQNLKRCPHVKWLFTSRPYQYILTEFSETSILHIPGVYYSEQIGIEVNRVIEHRVQRLSTQLALRQDLTDYMLTRLLAIEHRTYLWVHLVFHHFKQGFKRTISGLKELIDTMPQNVMMAYEKILGKSTDERRARTILTILLAAKRPLTLAELNIAVSILSVRYEELDLEDDEYFANTLRNCCGLLISVHQTRVYFLHQTVRDFLLVPENLPRQSEPLWTWRYSILLRDANRLLVQSCLNFLDAYDPDTDVAPTRMLSDEETDEDMGDERSSVGTSSDGENRYYAIQEQLEAAFAQRPFFEYATAYWADHFEQAGLHAAGHPDAVRGAIRLCARATESELSWFSYHVRHWRLAAPPKNCTALMVAAFVGLTEPARVLLQTEDPNRSDDSGKTALIYACRQGRLAVARLLVEHAARIDWLCYNERTALFEAVSSQNVPLTTYLLAHGADTTPQDQYGAVLHEAVRYGRDSALVHVLLAHGADVNAQTWNGQTALHHAVRNQNHTATKVLLEHGADANLRDEMGEVPLHPAARNQNQAAIRLLLAHGADANVASKYGVTPLQLAHRHGSSSVAFVLNRGG